MTTKVTAAVVVAAVLIQTGALCSCSKKEETTDDVAAPPKEITADMPWYDGKVIYVDKDIAESGVTGSWSILLGTAGDQILWSIEGYRPIDEPENPYMTEENFSIIRSFDMDGNHLCDIDASQVAKDFDPSADWCSLNRTYLEGNNLVAEVDVSMDFNFLRYKLYIDPATGEILSSEEMDSESHYFLPPIVVNGWTLMSLPIYSDPESWDPDSVNLEVTSPQGETTNFDLLEAFPQYKINSVDSALWAGDNKILVTAYDSLSFFELSLLLDLDTMTFTEVTDDPEYGWLSAADTYKCRYADGIGNLFSDESGIKLLNMEEKKEETYLSYDYCDINRADVANLNILSLTEDHIVLGGTTYRTYSNYMEMGSVFTSGHDDAAMMVILDKAAENPHTGDTVITAATLGSAPSYPAAEAMRLFTEEDNGCVVLWDSRYIYENLYGSLNTFIGSDDDPMSAAMTLRDSVMTNLNIDLMAGDGPDMILDAMGFSQLNRSDLLLDLSDVLPSDELYGNIIDAARVDGVLYQIPLSFALQGILVDAEDVDPNEKGFTFDSYLDYLYGPCNGSDPTQMNKTDFMSTCLLQMSDSIRTDSGYDFSSEGFRQAASFVAGLTISDWPEDPMMAVMYYYDDRADIDASRFITLAFAADYLRQSQGLLDSKILYGFPSAEANGPLIRATQSIAVSASTAHPDECKAFISILTGEEFQQLYASYTGLPLNPEAMRQTIIDCVDSYNRTYQQNCEWYSEAERLELGMAMQEADADDVFAHIDGYIRSAGSLGSTDSAVEAIMREELQSYFAGDKSLDEVIGIIQDRVDTFTNERG